MQAGLFCGVRSLPGDIQRLVPKPSQTVLTDGVVIDDSGMAGRPLRVPVGACRCLWLWLWLVATTDALM